MKHCVLENLFKNLRKRNSSPQIKTAFIEMSSLTRLVFRGGRNGAFICICTNGASRVSFIHFSNLLIANSSSRFMLLGGILADVAFVLF